MSSSETGFYMMFWVSMLISCRFELMQVLLIFKDPYLEPGLWSLLVKQL